MLKLERDRYSHEKLIPGITWIYDGINDSTYVDESEDSAFVIDTGMRNESLTDYIRKNITDKPLTLVVTHGHLDHSMHVAEFDRFYMSAKDDYLVAHKIISWTDFGQLQSHPSYISSDKPPGTHLLHRSICRSSPQVLLLFLPGFLSTSDGSFYRKNLQSC